MSDIICNNIKIVMLFPRADSVSAIGAFNNWSTVATPLSRTDEGKWELPMAAIADIEVDDLSFFVIPQGERFGRVINYRDVQTG